MLSQEMNNRVVRDVTRKAEEDGAKCPMAIMNDGVLEILCPQSGRTFAIELKEIKIQDEATTDNRHRDDGD